MIDKELIKKAVNNSTCLNIGLSCDSCPISHTNGWPDWNCGAKTINGRWLDIGLRPRAIRIMQEWLDKQEEKR
jgi:hypothetical protein